MGKLKDFAASNDITFSDSDADSDCNNDLVDLTMSTSHRKNGSPKCPRCHKPVSQKHLDLKNEQKIHDAHERDSALEEWQARKLPKIEWDKLLERCKKHMEYLEDIINEKKPSHYKEQAIENRRSFKKKKGRKALTKDLIEMGFEKCAPGYYGPKGAEIM